MLPYCKTHPIDIKKIPTRIRIIPITVFPPITIMPMPITPSPTRIDMIPKNILKVLFSIFYLLNLYCRFSRIPIWVKWECVRWLYFKAGNVICQQ
jgi:uncharacterized membrane protein YGL010W